MSCPCEYTSCMPVAELVCVCSVKLWSPTNEGRPAPGGHRHVVIVARDDADADHVGQILQGDVALLDQRARVFPVLGKAGDLIVKLRDLGELYVLTWLTLCWTDWFRSLCCVVSADEDLVESGGKILRGGNHAYAQTRIRRVRGKLLEA